LKYLDLYLIHTPFAFQPLDDQDPRDQNGDILYDPGVTLLDTWKAMESLVDHGKCRAIGLSDVGLKEVKPIYESARIKPAVVQVEAHPYLPETELLRYCRDKDIVFLAFAPLGHGMRPGPLEDPVIAAIAARVGKTPAARARQRQRIRRECRRPADLPQDRQQRCRRLVRVGRQRPAQQSAGEMLPDIAK